MVSYNVFNIYLFQWHALDRSEQSKYYEMARKEKELHLQLYPGWSARDNYACHTKKKRKKKDIVGPESKGLSEHLRKLLSNTSNWAPTLFMLYISSMMNTM